MITKNRLSHLSPSLWRICNPRRRLQVQSVYSSHKWKTSSFRGPPAFPRIRPYHLMTNRKKYMEQFFPNANPTLKAFLICQSRCCRDLALGKHSRSGRHESEVKSLALSAWIASPNAYRMWSKYFYIPSEHCLQQIKNSIDKEPGVNMDMIQWMHHECKRTNTDKHAG